MLDFLIEALKLGGIAAFTVGVMYLLYSQLMRMGVFAKMNQRRTFTLLMTVTILVFAAVVLAFTSAGGIKWSALTFNTCEAHNSQGTTCVQQ